jgi:hypothetical protein
MKNYKKIGSLLLVVFLALGIEMFRGEAFSRLAPYLQRIGISANMGLMESKGYAQFPYPTIYSVSVTAQGNGSGFISGNLAGDPINATYNGSTLSGDNAASVYQGSGPYTITATASGGSLVSWGGCDAITGNGTASENCILNAVNANRTLIANLASGSMNALFLPLVSNNFCAQTPTFKSISVGGYHTCGITEEGRSNVGALMFRVN